MRKLFFFLTRLSSNINELAEKNLYHVFIAVSIILNSHHKIPSPQTYLYLQYTEGRPWNPINAILIHPSITYLYVSLSPLGGGGFCHRNWKTLDPPHHWRGLSVTQGSGNRSSRPWDWARRGFPFCPHNRMTVVSKEKSIVN